MMPATIHPRRAAAQRGVALIVGLVILAVLSLIGIAAFSITTQEERMAGNSRDRIRAFEAAEFALRGCESFVKANGIGVFGTTAGMFQAPTTSTSQSKTEFYASKPESFWQTASNVHVVTIPSSDVAVQPSCIAELITLFPSTGYTVGNPLGNPASIAHITAHGYGLNSNTVVRLESYYSM
jgi:type IV pilus assembly protein PilX